MKKLLIATLMAVSVALGLAAPAAAETFNICPSGQTGVSTPDTSCPFADNVRHAWYAQPGTTVFAYSPVTGLFYTMQCGYMATDTWYNSKRCYGLNAYGAALIVYIS